jgi:simple sugar transport system ATP-binding protein
VSRILDASVGYIPEDTMGMAVVPQMRVEENLVLGGLHSYDNPGLWLDWGGIRRSLRRTFSDFPLALASPDALVGELSGGNVQRVVLARELARFPKVLMAYNPTRGLDVLTAEATRRLLMGCREQGGAIVLVSEDLDELLALSDNLVVMYQGRIVGNFQSNSTSVHEIGLLMTGHQR